MHEELRELLLNVLRVNVQLHDLADKYEAPYSDLSWRMIYAADAMRTVSNELEHILGASDDDCGLWDDITLLDDPANMDWDDEQYEPFTL